MQKKHRQLVEFIGEAQTAAQPGTMLMPFKQTKGEAEVIKQKEKATRDFLLKST